MGTTISDGAFTFESSSSDEAGVRVSVTEPAEETPAEASTTPETAQEAPGKAVPRDQSGKFAPKATEASSEAAEAAPESEQKPEEKHKKTRPAENPNERMKQATAQAAIAKSERDAARAELAAARAELEKIKTRADRATKSDSEPTEDAYDNYSDYVTARARWAARQEYEARQVSTAQERHTEAMERERQSRLGTFQQKLAAASADNPKFLDNLHPTVVNMTPISALPPGARVTQENAVAEAILHSDNPLALMTYLSSNVDELQRLTTLQLTQYQLTHSIARIEAKLEADASAGTSPRVEVSNAKPPVRPVTGSPHTSDGVSDDAPFEEHYRAMNARERAERR
jgi:hypothetical protein